MAKKDVTTIVKYLERRLKMLTETHDEFEEGSDVRMVLKARINELELALYIIDHE